MYWKATLFSIVEHNLLSFYFKIIPEKTKDWNCGEIVKHLCKSLFSEGYTIMEDLLIKLQKMFLKNICLSFLKN